MLYCHHQHPSPDFLIQRKLNLQSLEITVLILPVWIYSCTMLLRFICVVACIQFFPLLSLVTFCRLHPFSKSYHWFSLLGLLLPLGRNGNVRVPGPSCRGDSDYSKCQKQCRKFLVSPHALQSLLFSRFLIVNMLDRDLWPHMRGFWTVFVSSFLMDVITVAFQSLSIAERSFLLHNFWPCSITWSFLLILVWVLRSYLLLTCNWSWISLLDKF